MQPSRDIGRLIEIMAALRDPETGCPWDVQQDFGSIAPYTIEEAYEVADAIERGDLIDLKDELGDLLLQVVFHARMAQEQGAFGFDDVVEAITTKMVRRHPHVFGNAGPGDVAAAKASWETTKRAEKADRRAARRLPPEEGEAASVLAGVPVALPALTRAEKLSRKAASVGFDWPEPAQVIAKVREELAEVEHELQGRNRAALEGEVGDLLFAVANLARHLDVDAEKALRGTNAKFERRFRSIESALAAEGRTPAEASLDEMEALWGEVKASERTA
jgi:nucleoside triphosphate diphosphatase